MSIFKDGTYTVDVLYTGDSCPKCNRVRILPITLNTGIKKRICDKCSWCIEDDDYSEHEDMYGNTTDFFG